MLLNVRLLLTGYTSDEVKDLRNKNRELKEVVAEITRKNPVLKKSLSG